MSKEKLIFEVDQDKYILIPKNEASRKAQEAAFVLFENMQLKYINEYYKNDNNIEKSHTLMTFFIKGFLNGDSKAFNLLIGYDHQGMMTKFELSKILEDFNEMKRLKSEKKIKTFFMLDLVPYSNRRADCIVVTNEYEIELFDVSVGFVADKLRNNPDLTKLSDTELKQFNRKKKQNDRIESFKGKIKPSAYTIDDIVIDDKSLRINFYHQSNTKFYDINYAVKSLEKSKDNKVYIPNSVCFLTKEKINDELFVSFELANKINHPFFIRANSPQLTIDNYKKIKDNNYYIAISKYYLYIYLELFTPFKILKGKYYSNSKYSHQISAKINGKTRGFWIYDTRTKKRIALTFGLLYKHIYQSFSLFSLTEYISFLINQTETAEFHKAAYKYDEKNQKNYSFFNI